MKWFELKVGDLEPFVRSDGFRVMPVIPISTPRAISQSANPCAATEDTALIYVLDEQDQLSGYIGILPGRVYVAGEQRVYFNSCWWVKPGMGAALGSKLLFRMLQLVRGRIIFFEPTERTLAILSALPGICLSSPAEGFRGILGINLLGRFSRRFSEYRWALSLVHLAERLLNVPFRLYYLIRNHSRNESPAISIEWIDFPSESLWDWTRQFSRNLAVFRGRKELEWSMNFPWLAGAGNAISGESKKYFFSLTVFSWRQQWVRLSMAGETLGLLCLTVRDGDCKIPYAWLSESHKSNIGGALREVLFALHARSVTVFNPGVVAAFGEAGRFFARKKKLTKVMAWPSEMDTIMRQGFEWQDGDGDAVFT